VLQLKKQYNRCTSRCVSKRIRRKGFFLFRFQDKVSQRKTPLAVCQLIIKDFDRLIMAFCSELCLSGSIDIDINIEVGELKVENALY